MASSTTDSSVLLDYVPAVVQWHCPYQETIQCLDQISLRICFDEPPKSSYFKLRIPASFKALRKTHIFIPIAPDRITELQYTDAPEIPESVKRPLLFTTDPIVCFRFILAQHSVVIVPSDISLTPRNKKFGDVLESVRALSHATDFTAFFPVNDESFKPRASALCASIGSLSPVTSELDLVSLYNGRGARTLEDCDFALAAAPAPVVESPPSYDELGQLPEPSRSNPQPPAKKLKDGEEPWAQALRDLRADTHARLSALDARTQARLNDVADRLEARIDDRFEELRREVAARLDAFEARLEEVQDEAADTVDVRFEERIDGARDELREFVREEVKGVGDEVRREVLEGARLAIVYD